MFQNILTHFQLINTDKYISLHEVILRKNIIQKYKMITNSISMEIINIFSSLQFVVTQETPQMEHLKKFRSLSFRMWCWVSSSRHFDWMCCFIFKGWRDYLKPWRRRWWVPLKQQGPLTHWHRVICHRTRIFDYTVVKASKLAYSKFFFPRLLRLNCWVQKQINVWLIILI